MSHRLPSVTHHAVEVLGVRVTYREALPRDREVSGLPTLLLLHGFPSGSHQFRRLVDLLGTDHRIVAPDYPGFGPTGVDFAGVATSPWTFDWIADVVEELLLELGVDDVVAYLFDWGGPVGFRLAERHPSWIRALVIQNANAYDEGLSDAARSFVALGPNDHGAHEAVQGILQASSTRSQYLTGVREQSAIPPESWVLDQAYLDQGDRKEAQSALAFDYKSNLARYPAWQEWLRMHQPPTLIIWGRDDPFFTVAGALSFLRDLPDADLHLLATGHFALEERLETVADLITDFLRRIGANRAIGR